MRIQVNFEQNFYHILHEADPIRNIAFMTAQKKLDWIIVRKYHAANAKDVVFVCPPLRRPTPATPTSSLFFHPWSSENTVMIVVATILRPHAQCVFIALCPPLSCGSPVPSSMNHILQDCFFQFTVKSH